MSAPIKHLPRWARVACLATAALGVTAVPALAARYVINIPHAPPSVKSIHIKGSKVNVLFTCDTPINCAGNLRVTVRSRAAHTGFSRATRAYRINAGKSKRYTLNISCAKIRKDAKKTVELGPLSVRVSGRADSRRLYSLVDTFTRAGC